MSTNYTPLNNPLPATIALPEDVVDLRAAISVNGPFQALADAAKHNEATADAIAVLMSALPGVGSSYTSTLSIPATSGNRYDDKWLPETSDGYMTGMVLQTLGGQFVVPLASLPLVGVIHSFSMMLVGRGAGGGHSSMPANPFTATLYRYTHEDGYVSLGTCSEPVGQTVGVYDVAHTQTSGDIEHTIEHYDVSTWPANYSILVTGESGANAITGGTVWAFKLNLQGVSV